jgi:hypothetical protein
LAALADHYHTEAEELRALLARRGRDLATRRGRMRATVVPMHRSTRRGPDSGDRGS